MSAARAVPAGHPERPEGKEGVAMLARMNEGHHERLARWGLSHLDIAATASILDIGCGGGANLGRLLERAPEGRVVGLDHSPLSVKVSRRHNRAAIAEGRCDVFEGVSSDLPFKDATFDIVSAFETVYYWDLDASFAEVFRVLVPGGHFIICNEDNGREPEMAAFAAQIPGMVIYTPDELADCLYETGFEVVSTDERTHDGVTIIAIKPE